MFLTTQELQQLTGKKRPSAQICWLRDHGYTHTVNALGDPVVLIAEASRKLLGGGAQIKRKEPNWDALNGPSKAA